jgi:hypothetical protein
VIRALAYVGFALIVLGLLGFEIFFGSSKEWISERSLQLVLLGILVAGISSLILLIKRDWCGLLGLSAAAVAILWLPFFFTFGPHGIVSRITAPDGTQMCVIETPGGETRQTGFYYRRPGQRWGWFYYEHEDSHWWFGRIRLNGDGTQAILYRLFLPVARFDIPKERFTIIRWRRTLSPAQRWMPVAWKPEDALNSSGSSNSPMEVGAPDNQPPDRNGTPLKSEQRH